MSRLYHLDALRSFCMIYGIFFHAHSVAGFWLSSAISEASGFFRMATFFFVSAFLTAMILDTKGVAETLRSRLVALGVPLVVGYLTLVPLAKWGQFSIARLPGDPADLGVIFGKMLSFELSGAYLHLWFLIVLLVYLVTAPAVLALLRHAPVARRIGRIAGAVPARLQVLALAVLVGVACAVSMGLREVLLPESAHGSTLVRGCFFNYPFYLLGLAAHVFRDRFAGLFRVDGAAIGAALFCVLVVKLADGMPEQATWVLKGFVNTVAALGLTTIFARYFDRPGPRIAFLSRSIYSVYLVHFTFIFLFGYVFARLGAEGGLLYGLVVVCSIPASIAFHIRVVEASPLLRFLYNGRMTAAAARPVAQKGRIGL